MKRPTFLHGVITGAGLIALLEGRVAAGLILMLIAAIAYVANHQDKK